MALLLRRKGLERVRPLHGGFDAWREHGLPVESEDGLRVSSPIPDEPGVIPENLGESMVIDEAGVLVRLGDAWREGPVVLAFVRHFGCLLCRDFVLELQRHVDAIRELGAELLVVGHGTPEAATRFRAQFGLDFPVVVDPHRRIYESLGFRRNLGGTANPRVLVAALRAWLRGARQGSTEADPWQLGGVLIVQPGDEVSYRYESRFAGDHPKIEVVLSKLRRIA